MHNVAESDSNGDNFKNLGSKKLDERATKAAVYDETGKYNNSKTKCAILFKSVEE